MKKHFISLLITILTGNLIFAQPFEIWVSPNGKDSNSGTKDQPLASLLMAQRKAREMRRLNKEEINDGITIIIADGTYQLEEPILFRPEDSGTETSPTLIKAANNGQATLSGGVQIDGWKKYEGNLSFLPEKANGNIYVADIPMVGGRKLSFRQLWINNVKATRASNINDGELDRILSADKEKEILWIPIPDFNYEEIGQLELVIHQWWAIANLRVKNIEVVGDSAKVTFHQPESRIEFEHPWPAPFEDKKHEFAGNSAFYFVNSIALLNAPGEWYADESTGKIYYWPRKGEKMDQLEAIAPSLETLVEVRGSLDHPVKNIRFEGISFKHTTWMRPSEQGHVPLQAGMYLYDAYKLKEPGTPDKETLENQAWTGRQTSAVAIENASQIEFFRCSFRHMAATGIDFISGTSHDLIKGCTFNDIGGTAIQLGYFGSKDFEAHLPYDPADNRQVCQFETISNNLISDATNEDWGCVGIGVGFAHDVTIEHNEISHINYSGISMGWGWTKTINCMKNNYIHANYINYFARNMYDVAAVYTLSAQPNSEISENRMENLIKAPYAHIPEHAQYIYYDEATSYMRSINNWTEKAIYFENSPGPGNYWENNGSKVDKSIKENAGLEDEFKDLQNIYKDKSLAPIVAQDKKMKMHDYPEDYHFSEKGRGPR